MKNRMLLDELDLGLRFSDDEMRAIVGGDDTPINGGQYGPGVTIYPDPAPVQPPYYPPGIYYDPSTGGHDSAAPSSGSGGGGSGSVTSPGGGSSTGYVPSLYSGPGDTHLSNVARLPKEGDTAYMQGINSYCVYQTIENVSKYFGGDIAPGTSALTAIQITQNVASGTTGFTGTVAQLDTLISTYFNGSVTTNVTSAIDAGNPVMSFLNNGDGTGHDVMITGYNKDGTYEYYDPLVGLYKSGEKANFNNTFAITGLKN